MKFAMWKNMIKSPLTFDKPNYSITTHRTLNAKNFAMVIYESDINTFDSYVDETIKEPCVYCNQIMSPESLYYSDGEFIEYFRSEMYRIFNNFDKHLINSEILLNEIGSCNYYIKQFEMQNVDNKQHMVLKKGLYKNVPHVLFQVGHCARDNFYYFTNEKEYIMWKLKNG